MESVSGRGDGGTWPTGLDEAIRATAADIAATLRGASDTGAPVPVMSLGRLGPWSAVARGRVLTWGRRPWLAPRFPALFTPP